jgi:hypothetical protein
MYTKPLIKIRIKIKKIFDCFCQNKNFKISLENNLKDVQDKVNIVRNIIIRL